MLTRNIRTHRIILQDGREFPITSQQYQQIRLDKTDSKATEMFQLRDCDSGEVLFDGEFRAIKEFREVGSVGAKYQGATYTCMFNTVHKASDDCNCRPTKFISEEMAMKKKEWTEKLIATLSKEEVDHFREEARDKLKVSLEKGNIGNKFIEEMALCLIRKSFKCPYA